MLTNDRTTEEALIASLEETAAPEGHDPTPAQPRADLWSAMAYKPLRAVVSGLLLGVLLAALGALTILSGRTLYTSSTTMLIDDPYQLATSGQVTEFGNLDALRYKYAGLVGTDAIAGPVASKLRLPVGDVIGAVSTNVPLNSLLMTIQATWTTPQGAQRISESSANEVTRYITNEDNLYKIAPVDRFSFTVIDPASYPAARGPSKSKAATLAIGLGVLGFTLGFLGTQLIRYLRRQ